MDTVLVPYDGSTLARGALEFACEKFTDGELIVLYVVDTSISLEPETYVGVKLGEIYERREAEGREHLDEAAEIAGEYGRSITTVLDHGEPSKVILKQVTEHDADHVVMGSHSQGTIERFFLGSVSERVVERAPTSVSVIRE
ncbi:universal stress protein [Halobellus ruber]|uniref:Universal stress protein n=1 Tax=Halobellus ruber TaxID=2761102 RepID=A0A7J9SKI7_9EURY|nr:universal stress protein [Halobellus ruber]MBB6647474.1 universal stress protein [Halobellus ruber]